MAHIDVVLGRDGERVVCAKCRTDLGSAKVPNDAARAFQRGLEIGAELAGHCCQPPELGHVLGRSTE